MVSLLARLIGPLFNVIDKAVEDKDQAAAIKAQVQAQMIAGELSEMENAAKIILAEAQGESWLQRNWRPLLMLVAISIIANNFILAPYLQAMFGFGLALALPDQLWDLLTLGVGGYIAGRSGEKMLATWKRKE